MVDTELTVRVAASGAGKAAKDVAAIQDAIAKVAKEAKDTKAVAEQMGKAFNLPADEVEDLADAIAEARKETETYRDATGKLGDANQRFVKDTKDGFDQIGQKAKGLEGIFQGIAQGIGQQLTQVGVNAIKDSLSSVIGVVAAASKEFGSFDKALVEFDAKSSASAEQIARIGEQSKELAAITSQSPAGVAALSTALLTLGATADQVETNLKSITFLADVLGEDPVLTGQVVQTGVNIFGEFGETADTLSDKLNFLVNNTAAGATGGLGEFFQLFADVGGIVKSTGAEFDDLASAFAVLRNGGASASIAATGIKTALLALASPSSEANEELKKLNVSAFDSEGNFRGLGETLIDFSASLDGLSEEEQINIAVKIFGREGAPAFLQTLKEADGGLSQLRAQLGTEASGSLAESLEVINTSLVRQAELLSGTIDEALTSFGAAIAPVQSAILQFATATVSAFSEANNAFGPLTEAGERLKAALEENPEIAQRLGEALAQVAEGLAGGVTNGLNALADALERNPEAANDLIDGFSRTVQSAFELASALGSVLSVLAEVGANVGGASADAFNDLAPTIGVVIEFLGNVLSVLVPLTDNTELLSLAMQVLLVRMVALKGVALVQALQAMAVGFGATGVAAGGAGAAVTAFTATVTAAAPPLLVLAAAIAAVNFIKFTRDLGVANDNLDAFIGGIEASANTGFQFANRLNNLNDAIAAAGGKATDEQLRKLGEYKRLSQEQVEDLKQQLSEVQAFEPKNDAQRQSQQNLISQLNSTIGALEGQIKDAEGTLASAAQNTGEETGKNLATGVADGVESNKQSVEDALKSLVDTNKSALQDLQTDSLNAQAKLLESGATQEQIAAAEKEALQKRVTENKRLLEELQSLQSQGGSAEEAKQIADQIAQVDQQLAQDRVAIAKATVDAQKAAEAERAKAAKEAAEAKAKAAKEAAKIETDALKAQRDEEKRIADQRQADAEKAAQREFDDAREGRTEARDAQRRAEDKAAQKALQESDRAFQDERRESDRAFQKQQQAEADAFQDAQQAEAEAFQKRLDAERDRGSREFDVLTGEVERRIQLEQAADAEARRSLQEQFKLEDEQLKRRKQVEAEVLAQRGSVLSANQDQLELSPLEAARAAFEEQLQQKQAAFQEQQQLASQAFQEAQAAEAEARTEALRLEDEARADARAEADEARAEQRRLEDKAFEDSERAIQDAFEAQQRATKEAFNAQQRELDKANAQAIAAILKSAEVTGIAGARANGGPVQAGQTYLVGEKGPELITPSRSGYVHTAAQTAAMLSGAPVRGAAVHVAQPSTGAVEAKLDRLIAVVQAGRKVQAGPTSFVLQSDNPVADAVGIQLEQLRSQIRSGLL